MNAVAQCKRCSACRKRSIKLETLCIYYSTSLAIEVRQLEQPADVVGHMGVIIERASLALAAESNGSGKASLAAHTRRAYLRGES